MRASVITRLILIVFPDFVVKIARISISFASADGGRAAETAGRFLYGLSD